MKKDEVPQDDMYLGTTNCRDIYYAVDEDGNYCEVPSVGWSVKNDALSLTWESISEQAEVIRNEVMEGLKSPLAYHMEMNLMTPALLSSCTGISKRVIRTHMTPEGFSQADRDTLNIYAVTMNITLDELLKV
ncbi:MAG: hypothetical protein LBH04_06780 [Tannerellaceae bacterium]|jgi:hypothetical protein|nr:hypothetical protein [Tannerellaceae bacterium]